VRWVAFDLNGTLLDPAGVVPGEPELGRRALIDAVVLAMATTAVGEYRDFSDFVAAALGRRLDGAALEAAVKRASTLPPFPDAERALGRLADAGLRIAVVTNSAGEAADKALAAAGLRDAVDAVIGTEAIGAFKPDLRVYRAAEKRLAAAGDEVCLVAAHAWDLLGASHAGWCTAWVGHLEGRLAASVVQPDVVAPTLERVAEGVAGLG
jgi:2-haloacid dehalogenase